MGVNLNCVLLIDDDNITNFLHKQLLLRTGIVHNIIAVETVKEGLDVLTKNQGCENPELIFLDLNMPGLTGWDFIDEYKIIKLRCGIKSRIILLSSSANPADKKKAGDIEEVTAFLHKPLTDSMINEIMNKYFSS